MVELVYPLATFLVCLFGYILMIKASFAVLTWDEKYKEFVLSNSLTEIFLSAVWPVSLPLVFVMDPETLIKPIREGLFKKLRPKKKKGTLMKGVDRPADTLAYMVLLKIQEDPFEPWDAKLDFWEKDKIKVRAICSGMSLYAIQLGDQIFHKDDFSDKTRRDFNEALVEVGKLRREKLKADQKAAKDQQALDAIAEFLGVEA